MPTKAVPFIDANALGISEDDQIRLIGGVCMDNPGHNVGVIVKLIEDVGGIFGMKGDRYIRKLANGFPKVVVMDRSKLTGGQDGSELIRLQFPKQPTGGQ